MAFEQTKENIDNYAKNKLWYWHIPLWLFGAYLFVELLGFNLIDPQPFALNVMHAFDFLLHEFAHIFTGWMGIFISALAGSASELLLGGLLVYSAFQFRNYFAVLFCCLWLMLVCMSVGHYMADAVPQQIQLTSLGGALTGGEKVTHDWNFIFGELNMLGASKFIGGTLRVFGVFAGLFGLIFSAWIMYKMAASNARRKEQSASAPASSASNQPGSGQSGQKVPVYPEPTRGSLSHPSPAQGEEQKKQ